jgi:hypothetical protein
MWEKRIRILMWLALPTFVGYALILGTFVSAFLDRSPSVGLVMLAVVLLLPGGLYLSLVTIWHWKSRYRGSHSDLWGALLFLETSGWFKLVYLFRHLIPDARGRGRYVRTSTGDLPIPPPVLPK